MTRTRVWRLLQGYRDKPAAAVDATAEVLIRLGQIAAEHPEIRELDINPLLASAAGVVAVDARIGVAPVVSAASRLAIAPYPRELAGRARLRDGAEIDLRPIRPEDERPAARSRRAYDPGGFAPALSGPDPRLVASACGAADPDRLRPRDGACRNALRHRTRRRALFRRSRPLEAEYAVAVRSDWKGRGVGYVMMRRLIDIARQYGIGELVGDVLRENEPMLAMCRELGFAISADPNDAALIRVRKKLA